MYLELIIFLFYSQNNNSTIFKHEFNEICFRWPWNLTWIYKFVHSYYYVCLLFTLCHGTKSAKVLMVEKIYYHFTDCKFNNLTEKHK